MANAKAAFILPTSGSGVNGPSVTATWNTATYQAPVQASIAEIEAAHIGGANTSTSWALLSSLGLTSDNVLRGYQLKNADAANNINIGSSAAPGTSFFSLKPGESVHVPWNRVKDLYVASAAGTPRIEWLGC